MPTMRTIHEYIEDYAAKAPEDIAVIDQQTVYTYGDLNEQANQLANSLHQFNIKPNTIIALAIERSFELLLAMLGILKAGCGYLPIDPEHPSERLHYILDDARPCLLITQSKYKKTFASYTAPILFIDQVPKQRPRKTMQPLPRGASEHLAYVIYTSGSTGKPKGVLIEHRSLINYTQWLSQYCACRKQDRIDFSSHVIFDMAVTCTVAALALGLQIVICHDAVKNNIPQYLDYLKQYRIHIVKFTPSYFKLLTQEAKTHTIPLSDLKYIILGGEILYAQDCKTWLALYPKHILFNEYGPTETTVAVTVHKITSATLTKLSNIVPIGKPGLNIDCKLLDQDQKIIPQGETGELYISGACLARGYLNQKELTSTRFIPNPFDSTHAEKLYRTGDICRYLPDGNLEFLTRVDDQVKIRGYRIETGEIEVCLNSHPLIKTSCVVIHEAPSAEPQLIAYYILQDENKPVESQVLRTYLRQQLTDYMIPAQFIAMKAFPLTPNGKLDKKALPSPISEQSIVAPTYLLEQQLIDIWRRAFHIEQIGIHSNFFALGGHSVTAAKILTDIEMQLRKKIRLEDLYKAPTIHELAPVVAKAKKRRTKSFPFNLKRYKNTKQVIPLSDFQFMLWISILFEPKINKLNIIARRRVSGQLDLYALRHALQWTFEKHQVLHYQIKNWIPAQSLRKNTACRIIHHDLSAYSAQEAEQHLSASLNALKDNSAQYLHDALICVKVFYLQHNHSEIQICASHFCFDNISEEVLFSDLSNAYIHYKKNAVLPSLTNTLQYQDYVFNEQHRLNQTLKRDIRFWEKYWYQTSLITLPQEVIIQDMQNQPYSTYIKLPETLIQQLHQRCINTSISQTELIAASVALGLQQVTGNLNRKVLINLNHSTRDNDYYENMIGCFLRLNPVKVDLKSKQTLIDLARTIQRTKIHTNPYQDCSDIVKLACLNPSYDPKNIRNRLITLFSIIYNILFRQLKLNPAILTMYDRLNTIRNKQQFFVSINVLNNLLAEKENETLFGFKLKKCSLHHYDLLDINNVLEISFFKNMSHSYLVISGNLKPAFRQKLGREIMKNLNTS